MSKLAARGKVVGWIGLVLFVGSLIASALRFLSDANGNFTLGVAIGLWLAWGIFAFRTEFFSLNPKTLNEEFERQERARQESRGRR